MSYASVMDIRHILRELTAERDCDSRKKQGRTLAAASDQPKHRDRSPGSKSYDQLCTGLGAACDNDWPYTSDAREVRQKEEDLIVTWRRHSKSEHYN